MQRFNEYLGFYLIGIPIFIASIIWPIVEIPYALYFFGVSILLVFVREQIPEDPQHSTVTHYERISRWNWYNYTLTGVIIVSASVFVFTPIWKHLTIFLLWTVGLLVIYVLERRQLKIGFKKYLEDYFRQQFQNLTENQIQVVVKSLQENPGISSSELMSKAQLSESDAERIIHLYSQYVLNNLK